MATANANKLTKEERALITSALKQAHSSAERGIKAARNDKMREAWQDEANKLNALAIKINQQEIDL